MVTPYSAEIEAENGELLRRLGYILNECPRLLSEELILPLTEECNLSATDAFSVLLASAMGLDIDESARDRRFYRTYFPEMIRELDPSEYLADPYLRLLSVPHARSERWELREGGYEPYEPFVFDDFKYSDDGRIYPQIGFFRCRYRYPAVLESGREWMLITPNEINTMRGPIKAARGRVLTYGLGLGYYAFSVSQKASVADVTVVERDPEVISLFTRFILPQLPFRDKIKIVCADAFDFAEKEMAKGGYDTVFCDLWHDPSDGVALYLRMKEHEHRLPSARFDYWIEKTMRYYLP